MSEHHKENMDLTSFNFIQPMNLTFLPGWLRNLESMPEEDRATLEIYMAGNDKTKYTLTTNEQGDLVAYDGKSKLLLAGHEWKVPSATLEKLNKPKPPAPGRK